LYSCVPNPAGTDAGNEEITVVNRGAATVDLTDWKIRDFANKSVSMFGTILPSEMKTFTPSYIMVNNSGTETLYVVNPQGEVVHEGSYTGPVGDDEVVYFPVSGP
jgi:P pilus assembly chaperone PapD